MSNEPPVSDLFVSYASEDRARIEPLIEVLENRGWTVWWDRQLVAGPRFEEHIASALASARCVVVAWSKNALDSTWCRDEAQEGLDRDVLVPLRIDDVRPPLGFRSSQTASLIDWPRERGELDSLLAGIDACLKGTRTIHRDVATASSRERSRFHIGWYVAIGLALLAVLTAWLLRSEIADAPIPTTSVLVLPFEDLSAEANHAWLANGMAEALSFYLALVEPIIVKHPPAGLDHADHLSFGKQMGAGSAITGSIQRSGDQLLVSARLVEVSTGSQLWSATYEERLDDVFEVQRLLAREIVEAIEEELGLEVPANAEIAIREARYGASDIRAYEAYRKSLDIKFGRTPERATLEELEQALELNLKAVEIDPKYAQGHFGLGTTYGALARLTGDPTFRQEEQKAFDRALELDPGNPMVVGRQTFSALADWDWPRIISLVERLDPWTEVSEVMIAPYIIALVNVGRWEDAHRALSQVRRLVRRIPERFPPQHSIHAEIGIVMAMLRFDPHELIEYLEPNVGAGAPFEGGLMAQFLAEAYLAVGREDEALQSFVLSQPKELRSMALSAYDQGGRQEMLHAILQHDVESGDACRIGNNRLYAEIGDLARLLTCTELHRTARLDFLWTLPVFDRYRDDPRFQSALARRNIVGYENCCPPKE